MDQPTGAVDGWEEAVEAALAEEEVASADLEEEASVAAAQAEDGRGDVQMR